jgi:hypothetical protein
MATHGFRKKVPWLKEVLQLAVAYGALLYNATETSFIVKRVQKDFAAHGAGRCAQENQAFEMAQANLLRGLRNTITTPQREINNRILHFKQAVEALYKCLKLPVPDFEQIARERAR